MNCAVGFSATRRNWSDNMRRRKLNCSRKKRRRNIIPRGSWRLPWRGMWARWGQFYFECFRIKCFELKLDPRERILESMSELGSHFDFVPEQRKLKWLPEAILDSTELLIKHDELFVDFIWGYCLLPWLYATQMQYKQVSSIFVHSCICLCLEQ